jgi:hypothetical protein
MDRIRSNILKNLLAIKKQARKCANDEQLLKHFDIEVDHVDAHGSCDGYRVTFTCKATFFVSMQGDAKDAKNIIKMGVMDVADLVNGDADE